MKIRFLAALFCVACQVCLLQTAHAAILPITGATYSGTVTPGSPPTLVDAQELTSITTSEGTFSMLQGATSGSVAGQRFFIGSDPGADAETLLGLTATDGLLNLSSTANFQFGTTFNANTRFFLLEVAGTGTTVGDSATITLLDAGGNAISGLTLALAQANFGSALAKLTANREGDSSLGLDLGGLTFSLADFTGAGDPSLATGIRITGAGSLDPAVMGITAIPEPGSIALALGGVAALYFIRRRKS